MRRTVAGGLWASYLFRMWPLHYVLAPVALPQALWVHRTAPRLPEPEGARQGRRGQGRPLRLLITGDSSAAGVGVAHQEDALSGQLTRRLAHRYDVTWRVIARCGNTVPATMAMLRDAEAEPFDAAVIGLGVNDAKNGRTVAAWRRDYSALIDLLQDRFSVGRVYASGLPPVRHFPLLPWPTRTVVGTRADLFDAALRETVATRSDTVRYLHFDMALDASVMAEDGFHPGVPVFATWARIADEAISADFPIHS